MSAEVAVTGYALTKTVEGYSPGTRVTLLNFTKARTAFIQVECKDREVLEVATTDIVKLRERVKVVTLAEENHKQRYARLRAERAANV